MTIYDKDKFYALARDLAGVVYDYHIDDVIDNWCFIASMAAVNRVCKTLTGLSVWWAIADDATAIAISFDDADSNPVMQFSFDIEELED